MAETLHPAFSGVQQYTGKEGAGRLLVLLPPSSHHPKGGPQGSALGLLCQPRLLLLALTRFQLSHLLRRPFPPSEPTFGPAPPSFPASGETPPFSGCKTCRGPTPTQFWLRPTLPCCPGRTMATPLSNPRPALAPPTSLAPPGSPAPLRLSSAPLGARPPHARLHSRSLQPCTPPRPSRPSRTASPSRRPSCSSSSEKVRGPRLPWAPAPPPNRPLHLPGPRLARPLGSL